MSSSHRFADFLCFALGFTSFHRAVLADAPATRPTISVIDETWHDAARDRDVPVRLYLPAEASKPAPAILVSHGLGDSRAAIAYACRPWAEDGLVVIALEHAGSDFHIWGNGKATEEFARLSKAASVENFVLRCGDVHFALDELQRRTQSNDGVLAGRIDLGRIGLAGHSFGALTAQAIIGERFAPVPNQPLNFADPRIKAAVVMSPGVEGALPDADAAYGGIRVPVFYFTGTADVATGLGATLSSRRRVPFDHSPLSDRYLAIYDRGDHLVFSGHRPGWIDVKRYDRIQLSVAQLSTDFWNATLGDDTAARERILDRARAGLMDADKLEHRPATTQPTQ